MNSEMLRRRASDDSIIAHVNPSPTRLAGVLGLPTLGFAASVVAAWRRAGPVSLPPTVKRVGAITAVAGVGLTAAGMSRFTPKQVAGAELDRLVDSGVYRVTRNPQYTGYTLSLVGLAVALGSGGAALLGAGVVASLRYWISLEESYLDDKLGEAYREYRRRTHRWLGLPNRAGHSDRDEPLPRTSRSEPKRGLTRRGVRARSARPRRTATARPGRRRRTRAGAR
ncbi:methyltransferase family protein [Actinopolyspora halophila]|uniref:methyltransferase family protein n=1 Tax=Actinopolyspora halophila TaxID=1850 RepID=UPI000476F3BE|nr:isoprenylcysteine carboxylmethyltransferase family protein [Actinopolyspora halophila]